MPSTNWIKRLKPTWKYPECTNMYVMNLHTSYFFFGSKINVLFAINGGPFGPTVFPMFVNLMTCHTKMPNCARLMASRKKGGGLQLYCSRYWILSALSDSGIASLTAALCIVFFGAIL